MLKPIVSIVAAAAILSPLAFAGELKPITVSITYDTAELATEAGAASVLASVTDQATKACTSYVPVFGGLHTDRACVEDVVASAISKIQAQQAAEGQETAGVFASKAVMFLADAGQR